MLSKNKNDFWLVLYILQTKMDEMSIIFCFWSISAATAAPGCFILCAEASKNSRITMAVMRLLKLISDFICGRLACTFLLLRLICRHQTFQEASRIFRF